MRIFSSKDASVSRRIFVRNGGIERTVARFHGELGIADVLNIGQFDDGTYNASVERVGLDGGQLPWETTGYLP